MKSVLSSVSVVTTIIWYVDLPLHCLAVHITTKVVGLIPPYVEEYSIQLYMDIFLRHECCFRYIPRFPPPIKLIATI